MPVDYSLGKIYKIVGNGKVYVGSTCERLLCQRFSQHKRNYNKWLNGKDHYVTSFECFTDPDCNIELLELCPCTSKDELRKCEGKWIRDLDCVNRCVAGRSQEEYYKEEKKKVLEKMRLYREANRDEINAKQNFNYHANHEERLEKMRVYREEHREEIAKRQRERRALKKAEKTKLII